MPILLTNASPSTGREWIQSISRLDCRPSGHDPGSYVVDKVAGQVTESAAGQAGQDPDCRHSGHDPGSYVADKVAGQVTESAAGQAGQASQAAGQVAGQAAEMTSLSV